MTKYKPIDNDPAVLKDRAPPSKQCLIMGEAERSMRMLAAEFGLTPSSRSEISVPNRPAPRMGLNPTWTANEEADFPGCVPKGEKLGL
jgi:phage terminase small subunit